VPSPDFGLLEWLRGASIGALLTLRAHTTPSPTSRPRVSKFSTYYAKGYQIYMSDCTKQFASQRTGETLTGHLGCLAEIIVAKPKTTKLSTPRGDVDNYGKGCLDAATKAEVWGDDGQVIAVGISKRWAEPGEEPGVQLHIGVLKQ
jgi:Holliday junction resolvase RusA-like endonuclease